MFKSKLLKKVALTFGLSLLAIGSVSITNVKAATTSSNTETNSVEFTTRELDVLQLILEEKTTSEIAEKLKISPFTVEGHRKNLMQKTNSKNVVGLIKYSLLNNII